MLLHDWISKAVRIAAYCKLVILEISLDSGRALVGKWKGWLLFAGEDVDSGEPMDISKVFFLAGVLAGECFPRPRKKEDLAE